MGRQRRSRMPPSQRRAGQGPELFRSVRKSSSLSLQQDGAPTWPRAGTRPRRAGVRDDCAPSRVLRLSPPSKPAKTGRLSAVANAGAGVGVMDRLDAAMEGRWNEWTEGKDGMDGWAGSLAGRPAVLTDMTSISSCGYRAGVRHRRSSHLLPARARWPCLRAHGEPWVRMGQLRGTHPYVGPIPDPVSRQRASRARSLAGPAAAAARPLAV